MEPGLTSHVFPTYKPGPTLETTWKEVVRFLDATPDPWEVLFVCDGCRDSVDRLTRWSRGREPQVRVLSHFPNRGKGFAVRRGLSAARGTWRLFTDVDLAYGFEDVARLAKALRDGADVAIASRSHPESRLLLPVRMHGYVYRRHLQSLVFSKLARWILPLKQHDSQAGLKGLSARAAELLLPELHCDGFEFDCELLTACEQHGLTVAEIPVCVRHEEAQSTTNWRAALRMLLAMWRIRKAWLGSTRTPGWEHPDWVCIRPSAVYAHQLGLELRLPHAAEVAAK